MDGTTKGNVLNKYFKKGLRHDPQKDEYLKERQNSLQVDQKCPKKYEASQGSECTVTKDRNISLKDKVV